MNLIDLQNVPGNKGNEYEINGLGKPINLLDEKQALDGQERNVRG